MAYLECATLLAASKFLLQLSNSSLSSGLGGGALSVVRSKVRQQGWAGHTSRFCLFSPSHLNTWSAIDISFLASARL